METSPASDHEPAASPERHRTVVWDGADPVAALLGVRRIKAGNTGLTPREFHYNPLGTVHGGVIATILDMAMTDAVTTAIAPGSVCTRLEIKVNYLRALTAAAGEVVGEAIVVQAGRRIATATARLVDAGGRLYATASATFLVSVATPASAPAIGAAPPWEFDWSDPTALARAGAGMAGIDFLRAMASGALPPPPVMRLLGIRMGEVMPGRVAMLLPQGPHLHDPAGRVHGGMIVTLLDSVMGCAVSSTLPHGCGYTTVELRVNFIAAIPRSAGPITGVGALVHAGNQVAVGEARAADAAGIVYAIASTTCLKLSAGRPA